MAEKIYFYDGTWQGIMSVYHGIIGGELEAGVMAKEKGENMQDDLFSEKIFVEAGEDKFTALKDRFIKAAGCDNYSMMLWAFLSEKRGIEGHILDFIRFALKNGKGSGNLLSEDEVMRVYSAAQQVRRECHRFKGFIRFEEIKPGMFYSGIEPDYNIIMLLAPHFKQRLSSQDWIIHDKKRNTAVFYDGSKCLYREVISFEMPDDSKEENEYKAMWLKYFQAMGIKERKNPHLQRQFVPVKYRKNMIEFDETGF
jgi:probable DNA metabolism protein